MSCSQASEHAPGGGWMANWPDGGRPGVASLLPWEQKSVWLLAASLNCGPHLGGGGVQETVAWVAAPAGNVLEDF
jgi:hypothetical protein